jgi:hypothetical protein
MKLIKLLVIASILLITGCATTVPVTAKFPDAPILILEKCPQLKKIDGENVSIVDFTKTVTLNYTTYYECAVKSDAWIEWYQKQKKIFEEVQGD